MVGRNDIVFSGYKSHKTTEQQRGKKEKPRTVENKKSQSQIEKKQGKHTGGEKEKLGEEAREKASVPQLRPRLQSINSQTREKKRKKLRRQRTNG